MDYETMINLLGIYALIGVMISLLGGAWKGTTPTRTYGVKIVQILFLTFLWMPMLIIQVARGREAQ